MLRSVLAALMFVSIATLSLTACAPVKYRGGTPPEEYGRYSIFFTPTHHFECSDSRGPSTLTVVLIPGDVYGASDFSGFEYGTIDPNFGLRKFADNVIGLRFSHVQGFNADYALINPDGEFAMSNYPTGIYDGRPSLFIGPPWSLKCTNESGSPPFKQIDVNAERK